MFQIFRWARDLEVPKWRIDIFNTVAASGNIRTVSGSHLTGMKGSMVATLCARLKKLGCLKVTMLN
jgi:hypothetical protein